MKVGKGKIRRGKDGGGEGGNNMRWGKDKREGKRMQVERFVGQCPCHRWVVPFSQWH